MRIDAHQHFWSYDPIEYDWIDDDMKPIRRDMLPSELLHELSLQGIQGSVAVQARQSEAENAYLLDLAAQRAFILGVVGWVDLRSPNLPDRLQYYQSQHPKMKGFRHVLQGEPRRDIMLQPDFKRGIGMLADYGFTYDILIFPDQLGFSTQLAEAFPGQSFVIDHIAKPPIKSGDIAEWERGIREIATLPNVYCKVSGLVTEADWKQWTHDDFKPYLDVVFESFGANKLMYGSDWPVCNVAGGYERMMRILTDYTSHLDKQQSDGFWGANAKRFYKL